MDTPDRTHHEAVYQFIFAKSLEDVAKRELDAAKEKYAKAVEVKLSKILDCAKAEPGVYAFKECGRTVAVIDYIGACPQLMQVVR